MDKDTSREELVTLRAERQKALQLLKEMSAVLDELRAKDELRERSLCTLQAQGRAALQGVPVVIEELSRDLEVNFNVRHVQSASTLAKVYSSIS